MIKVMVYFRNANIFLFKAQSFLFMRTALLPNQELLHIEKTAFLFYLLTSRLNRNDTVLCFQLIFSDKWDTFYFVEFI